MSEGVTPLSDLGMIRASKERKQNARWKREEKAECGVGDSGGKGPRDWQPEEIKTDRRRGESKGRGRERCAEIESGEEREGSRRR